MVSAMTSAARSANRIPSITLPTKSLAPSSHLLCLCGGPAGLFVRLLSSHPHLSLLIVHPRQGRQILQGPQVEGAEKGLGGAIEPGPAGHLQAPALLDQLPLKQQPHGVGAVHAPDLVHIGPGGGLVVGDDGQHLQGRLTESGRPPDLKGPADDVRVLRRGAQLPAVLHAHQPHPPALKGVVIPQPTEGLLRPGAVRVQGHAQAADVYRLAGGEQDRLGGDLHFRIIQLVLPSSQGFSLQLQGVDLRAGGGDGAVPLAAGEGHDPGPAELQDRQEGGDHLAAAAAAPEQEPEAGDAPAQPVHDLRRLARHRVGLLADNLVEIAQGRRQPTLLPVRDLPQGRQEIRRPVAVLVDLSLLQGLRVPAQDVPAELPHRTQDGGDPLDPLVVLAAAPLLQGANQLLHLAFGLLVLQGQEHSGLDEHQLSGHGDKLAGHLQIHLLAQLQVGQILLQNEGDGDILYLDLVLAQQIEDQIQRALKVLHALPAVHHALQFIDRYIHPVTSMGEK